MDMDGDEPASRERDRNKDKGRGSLGTWLLLDIRRIITQRVNITVETACPDSDRQPKCPPSG